MIAGRSSTKSSLDSMLAHWTSQVMLRRLGALLILLAAPPGWSHDAARSPVGEVTAIQGHVVVARPGSTIPVRVRVQDDLLHEDVIRTAALGQSKILLEDKTLLTVGSSSVVEMAGHTYASSIDTRSVTVKLTKGKVRALVGRSLNGQGQGSELIVHTPTASVSSQGTYLVVWADNTMSGIANIGTKGEALLKSENKTVVLQPGQFTMAGAHAGPEKPRALTEASAAISDLVASTEYAETVPERVVR